jgi:tagatose 1,6-diphosphate aldolase GatY/KbaY
MRSSLSQVTAAARAGRAAVAAFTCYDLEAAIGVLEAAERREAGVMLLVSSAAFSAPGGTRLVTALRALADASPVPVSLQLDHVDDLQLMRAGFEAGVDCVMADGSNLEFDENVELVRAAVALGVEAGGEVEAELGRIEGDEESAGRATPGGATDPDEAARFVRAARPACLAVAVGNAHGRYRLPPKIDVGRLSQIARVVPVPLALHGASGLGDEVLRAAVASGAAKVNVNTELRERYLATTADQLAGVAAAAELLALHQAQIRALGALADAKIACCAGEPISEPRPPA